MRRLLEHLPACQSVSPIGSQVVPNCCYYRSHQEIHRLGLLHKSFQELGDLLTGMMMYQAEMETKAEQVHELQTLTLLQGKDHLVAESAKYVNLYTRR